MSYLSLLAASPAERLSWTIGAGRGEEREAFPPEARPDAAASRPDEYALPLGVCSIEHWLDLNA